MACPAEQRVVSGGAPVSFTVRTLAQQDIAPVVALHRALLGYSINALLGTAHLAFVYRTVAALPATLVCVAVHNATIIGAVSATRDEAATTRALLARMPVWQRLRAAGRALTSPACLRALWLARHTNRPGALKGTPIHAVLTSLIVDPRYQGRGVGHTLVAAVDDFMRAGGQTCYRLDTRAHNLRARAFYARLGFREHAQRGRDIVLIRAL